LCGDQDVLPTKKTYAMLPHCRKARLSSVL